MRIEQKKWTEAKGWTTEHPEALGDAAQLVLMFGDRYVLGEQSLTAQIKTAYPCAHILGCSTAGEICGIQVLNHSMVTTAISFERTRLQGAQIELTLAKNSFQAGERLAQSLDPEGLVHVLVLSDGLAVNGSDLVRGLAKHLPDRVAVTGGLAGDGERFEETLVFWDGVPQKNTIAALGLYGSRLKVGYGSLGGWDPFGPERLITRSRGNVLYEFDGRSALELYKKYLGKHARGLPATGLLFPLSLRGKSGETGVVRTILSVNEQEQSITFAGDVPEGSYARLMKANFDRLIDGAIGAARTSYQATDPVPPDLAILISCVGRKLVLRQRIEEEWRGFATL